MKELLQMHFKVAVRKSCNQEREAQLLWGSSVHVLWL